MAEQHGFPMSPRFGENFSMQRTPYTDAFEFNLHAPHSDLSPNQQEGSSSSNRPRGRPKGAKNKLKPPIFITQDKNFDMKPTTINVLAGADVVKEVVQQACHRNAGIIIVHAWGTISKVTLAHPFGQDPAAFTLYGPFSLVGLHGSYLTPPSHDAGFPSSPGPVSIPNLSSPAIDSSFEIRVSGLHGHVFGGIVAGKVIAAECGVTVRALFFRNPEYHSVGVLNKDDIWE